MPIKKNLNIHILTQIFLFLKVNKMDSNIETITIEPKIVSNII